MYGWSGAADVPLNPKHPTARLRPLEAIRPDAVLVDAEGESVLEGFSYAAARVRTIRPATGLSEPRAVDSEEPRTSC